MKALRQQLFRRNEENKKSVVMKHKTIPDRPKFEPSLL